MRLNSNFGEIILRGIGSARLESRIPPKKEFVERAGGWQSEYYLGLSKREVYAMML